MAPGSVVDGVVEKVGQEVFGLQHPGDVFLGAVKEQIADVVRVERVGVCEDLHGARLIRQILSGGCHVVH